MTTTSEAFQNAVIMLRAAEDQLLAVVMADLVRVAINEQIDRMDFLLTTRYYRNDVEVESPRLRAIEDAYLQINKYGFEDIWTRTEGWASGQETPARYYFCLPAKNAYRRPVPGRFEVYEYAAGETSRLFTIGVTCRDLRQEITKRGVPLEEAMVLAHQMTKSP